MVTTTMMMTMIILIIISIIIIVVTIIIIIIIIIIMFFYFRCRRFAACKRYLNLSGSRNLGKITGQFLAHSSTFRC